MTQAASTADAVALDACCLIKLAAADALDPWFGDLGLAWKLPEAVLNEALFLRVAPDAVASGPGWEHGDNAREPILLGQYIDSGLLTVVRPETDAELAGYVALARELDDGEAMALAVAQTRGWQVATDDRKAIRLAPEAGISVRSTPAIVNRWVDRSTPSPAEIRSALVAIRDRARFLPSPRDPLCDWWMALLAD